MCSFISFCNFLFCSWGLEPEALDFVGSESLKVGPISSLSGVSSIIMPCAEIFPKPDLSRFSHQANFHCAAKRCFLWPLTSGMFEPTTSLKTQGQWETKTREQSCLGSLILASLILCFMHLSPVKRFLLFLH